MTATASATIAEAVIVNENPAIVAGFDVGYADEQKNIFAGAVIPINSFERKCNIGSLLRGLSPNGDWGSYMANYRLLTKGAFFAKRDGLTLLLFSPNIFTNSLICAII